MDHGSRRTGVGIGIISHQTMLGVSISDNLLGSYERLKIKVEAVGVNLQRPYDILLKYKALL